MHRSLFALLSIFVVASSCHRAEQNQRPPLKLGAIVSLTGPAAEQGKSWLLGAQLAQHVLEKKHTPVELIIVDDQTKPAEAASAYTRLVNIDHAQGILGGTWDFLGEAIYPLALRYKIPTFTPSNPSEILPTPQDNPFVLSSGLSLAATREAMNRFLQKEKPKSLAIIVPNVSFGTRHAHEMEEAAKTQGIEVRFRSDFDFESYQDTLRTLASRVAGESPDATFIIADYAGLDVFLKALRGVKGTSKILTTQHLDKAYELSGRNATLYEGATGIYPAHPSAEFTAAFQSLHFTSPEVYAPEGYDGLMLLAHIAQKNIDLTSRPLPHVMTGLRGNYALRTDSAEVASVPAILTTLHNGQFIDW